MRRTGGRTGTGGSFENRLRLPQEIVDALKSELDIPVGIRISVLEYEEDGYSAEYGVKVADSLRGIDYVHLSSGRNAPPGSSASFYSDTLHILRMIGRRPRVTTVQSGQ
ncbi:hypothetical protein [Thermogymnomonas acidicola]|uniref:hypothetical protein n=1 Tax=Thermogymnomonas acidicola TaxID=399579 RepID=UPI001396A3C0|nr:hypothetical protein [Thermogymnomonas acidicola]